ncbi:MAG: VWA domain-containing protein [Acidobacteria bacterium]|nr:VWA domain-containing protein [Acidobacteriota bacterium]
MPFTSSVPKLEQALSRMIGDGQTALYDAIAAGFDHLKQARPDKKVLIVISDGGDNASKHTLADIMAAATRSDIIIYTIGLFDENDPDKNPGMLKRLAKATGGEVFLPESVGDVVPICRKIATYLRNQYALTYETSNRKHNGAYRKLEVKAEAPGQGRLSVRVRPGYYAALDGTSKQQR